MFRTIQWTSGSRLSCVGCAPANVILCVDSDLLAERTCPASDLLSEDTPDGVFIWNTMPAELVDSQQVKNNCGGAYFWRYTFNYDDAYIKTGSNLSSSDITGVVCQGCLTQYVEDSVGSEIVLESVDATEDVPAHLKLTSQHGCEYDFFQGTSEPTQCISEFEGAGGEAMVVTATDDYELLAETTPFDVVNPSATYPATVAVDFLVTILAASLSPGFSGTFRIYSYPDEVKTLQRTFIYTQSGSVDYDGHIDILNFYLIDLAAGQTLTQAMSVELTTDASGSGVDTVTAFATMRINGTTCVG